MANYLDFLVAFDDHIRSSNLGYVIYGHELHAIAQAAGLVAGPGDFSAARWTGECVASSYITHNPPTLGDHRPIPHGAYTPDDLSRFSDYRITPAGRTEADRVRRQRREELTDVTLGGLISELALAAFSEPHRRAVMVPLTNLRAALDNEHHVSAVGAAKDLAEAACKVMVDRSGEAPANSLPALFKLALTASGRNDAASDLGRSLAGTVQRLAELRNTVGAGHGRASQPAVRAREARLAATAACGIVLDPGA